MTKKQVEKIVNDYMRLKESIVSINFSTGEISIHEILDKDFNALKNSQYAIYNISLDRTIEWINLYGITFFRK